MTIHTPTDMIHTSTGMYLGVQMQKRLYQVDAHTGEVQDGYVAYISPKRKNGFQKGWIAMSQENALLMMAKSNIGHQASRVLFMLLAKVEFENYIVVSQAEMAAEIGMLQSNFAKAVTRLVNEGIIQRGPKVGRQGSLRLNPHYGWKGTAKNHIIALDGARKKKATVL